MELLNRHEAIEKGNTRETPIDYILGTNSSIKTRYSCNCLETKIQEKHSSQEANSKGSTTTDTI